MKKRIGFLLILGLIFCGSLFAQTELAGTWQGKLVIDQNNKMTIQFILTKQADGSYKAVLDSPDSGAIKNVPADTVKYSGGKLSIEVTSLSGSYTGTMGKGTITGEWKQPGSTLPLVLTPYKKPAAASFKPLLGEWAGKLTVPGVMNLTVVFRFEIGKDGNLAGYMDVPDQNVKGLAVSTIAFEAGQVSVTVQAGAPIQYTGQLSGNSIKGTFKQGGSAFELNFTKGKYQVPGIDMPEEDMNKLLGQWAGRMKIAPDENADMATVIFRFEKAKDGKLAAFMDSPEQGSKGLALIDVTLKGDVFGIKLSGIASEYTGKLSGNAITGTFTTAGMKMDLTVTKGASFPPPVTQIELPADVMKKLLGRWSGSLSVLTFVVRFERSAAGKDAIFIDIPQQNVKSMPVLKATLTDGQLSLKIVGAEYVGKLEGNKINGTFKARGQNIPVPLTKE